VGSETQIMVVGDQAPLVNTVSSELGTTVSGNYILDMPLFDRNPTALVFLAPGVTNVNGGDVNALGGLNFSSNGQRTFTSELRLDGAVASVPEGGDRERLRVVGSQVEWLEQACDEVNAELAPLKSFLLPGGTPAAAQLHVCRTVCRRAERRAVDCGDELNPECVRYLNRLSDLLFILARSANGGDEPLWEPGRYRD